MICPLFRAKRTDNEGWVQGYYFKTPLTDESTGAAIEEGLYFLSGYKQRHCIATKDGCVYEIDPETLGQYTGLNDGTKWEEITYQEQMEFYDEVISSDGINIMYETIEDAKRAWHGRKIFEDDITELEINDGYLRRFLVSIETVNRHVINHPDFEEGTSKVAIKGVVFKWKGYELFPCVDDYGIPDNKRMKKVGNIYDNLELLEV